MKDLTFSALLGIAIGTLLKPYLGASAYWDWTAWVIVGTGLSYIVALWYFDNRNEID